MIAVYALLFRIFSGEKYNPPSREDTKLWFALLASTPPCIGISYLLSKMSHDWPIFFIWAGATLVGVALLVFWFLITKLPGIKSISLLAIIEWAVAFWLAFNLDR